MSKHRKISKRKGKHKTKSDRTVPIFLQVKPATRQRWDTYVFQQRAKNRKVRGVDLFEKIVGSLRLGKGKKVKRKVHMKPRKVKVKRKVERREEEAKANVQEAPASA